MNHPDYDGETRNLKCPNFYCHIAGSQNSVYLIGIGKDKFHCNGCQTDFIIQVDENCCERVKS